MIASEDTNKQSSTRLTIMQVLPRLYVGGVERGTIEFSIYLKQQGHRPIVVSHGGPLVEDLLKHGIQHIQLNVEKKSLSTLLSVAKIRKIIVEQAVDVVHARSRVPAWLCYLALKKINNRPRFVTTLHGLHSISKYSSVMARGDRVIAVSEAAKNYLNDHFKTYLKAEPVVIYRGIDRQFQYGYQANEAWKRNIRTQFKHFDVWQKVLLPGRLSPVKGIERILPWLKSSQSNVRLLLTADPNESNYSQKIQQMLGDMGLAEKVVWLGVVREMPNLYASVDLVVSTNRKPESFGRTVLEALSIGKPVVAFDHGGVSEIMNILYPQGLVANNQSIELSVKINQFLQHAPTVKPHNSFKNVTMFEQTLALYHDTVSQA